MLGPGPLTIREYVFTMPRDSYLIKTGIVCWRKDVSPVYFRYRATC